MLGWFQALMPKEMRFFDLFERHARIVVAGAESLRGLLQGGETIEQYCRQIFEREAEADEVTRQVLTAVAPHLHYAIRPYGYSRYYYLDG